MDIYRKELNRIYAAQQLDREELEAVEVREAKAQTEIMARISRGTTVLTDAASDRCFIFGGSLGKLMGFFKDQEDSREEYSSDEDIIYMRIHPEDLVDKRMLEYEFFRFINNKDSASRMNFKALCRVRMKDAEGFYRYINNSTQIFRLSPKGKMWLILCCYNLSESQAPGEGIEPTILNTSDGEIMHLQFGKSRENILSRREKEVLRLIRDGLSSKIIADRLNISLNTVSRHRQNIISKLSVANSIEAVTAAQAMKLI